MSCRKKNESGEWHEWWAVKWNWPMWNPSCLLSNNNVSSQLFSGKYQDLINKYFVFTAKNNTGWSWILDSITCADVVYRIIFLTMIPLVYDYFFCTVMFLLFVCIYLDLTWILFPAIAYIFGCSWCRWAQISRYDLDAWGFFQYLFFICSPIVLNSA